ncbi:hypothetical protein J3E68DRAFT_401897 [Trichoderma sp. SZMC 28012]
MHKVASSTCPYFQIPWLLASSCSSIPVAASHPDDCSRRTHQARQPPQTDCTIALAQHFRRIAPSHTKVSYPWGFGPVQR